MRTLLLVLAVAAFSGSALLADDDDKKAEKKPALKAGDPAPPLKATKWLTGAEVTTFAPGKVYVVEFWATWCGPCIVMMPHLGDIQEELGPKGLTVIGFTSKDPNNSQDKVVKFVDKRGDKLGYTIAYADDRETYDAYMKAAGKSGIPCSYVIGKDGKIAYIGHPLFLDEVLAKVMDGTWDVAKGTEELEAADKEWEATYNALTKKGNPAERLAKWEAFSAKWPRLASDPYMTNARLRLLAEAKRFDDVRTLTTAMATKAIKRNDLAALSAVADAVSGLEGQTDLAAIGVRAAEAALAIDGESVASLIRVTKAHAAAGNKDKVEQHGAKAVAAAEKALTGEKDAMGTLRVAAAYAAAGNKDKAKETAEKAIEMVDPKNARMKQAIEAQAKQFGAEPKKDDKKDG